MLSRNQPDAEPLVADISFLARLKGQFMLFEVKHFPASSDLDLFILRRSYPSVENRVFRNVLLICEETVDIEITSMDSH